MTNTSNNSNSVKRISVSRNHPSAFVVGAGNFIAARVIEKLLESKTQVLAFDRLTERTRENLQDAFKYKHFYFFSTEEDGFAREALDILEGELPSVGYGFLFAGSQTSVGDLRGFLNLAAKFGKDQKSQFKCVMVSSIGLYKKTLNSELRQLKTLEVLFAKGVAEKKLNGRIVRMAAVYGPRMNWDQSDPLVDLLRAAMSDKLREGGVSDEFSSRAIYVERASELVIKSVLNGSTATKIYDGALVHPLKVSELREVLMDVDWSLENKVKLTRVSPWLSPNLEKTVRELNWTPETETIKALKETLEYFRKNPERVESQKALSEKRQENIIENVTVKKAGARSFWDDSDSSLQQTANRLPPATVRQQEEELGVDEGEERRGRSWGKKFGYLLLVVIIGYGLIYPLVMFGIGVTGVGWNLTRSNQYLSQGKYSEATLAADQAVEGVAGIKRGFGVVETVGKIGIATKQINEVDGLIESVNDAVVAIRDANRGFETLSLVTAVISGENRDDPQMIYNSANVSLRAARESLTKVELELSNANLQGLSVLRSKIEGLRQMVLEYNLAVSKGEVASMMLPAMTGVGEGNKSYLVALQNNKNLRASGGVIEAVARIDFEKGRLTNIESLSSEELDAKAPLLAAPAEIHQDLGAVSWSIAESSYEPDFAANAQVVELLYSRDTGKKVDGVIGVDLTAFNGMVSALKGVNIRNGEVVIDGKSENKFFEQTMDRRVYGELLGEMLKKMFFLEKVNWAELGVVIDEGLRSKDIQIFSNDKSSFAYVSSQNWSGVMLRQSELVTGEERDFLSVNNVVIATGSANISLGKKLKLKMMITEDLGVSHKLAVEYTPKNINGMVAIIKSRVRIYVPGGNKLDRVTLGGAEVTRNFKTESDFGRIVFSGLIEIPVGVPSVLEVGYSAGVVKPLEGGLDYRLDVVKQAGTEGSDLDWSLDFPQGWKVSKLPSRALSSNRTVSMSDILDQDLTISVSLKQP